MAQDKNLQTILPKIVFKGLFDNSPTLDTFDLDYFEQRISDLKLAFKEDFITHTLALKANPIRGVIRFANVMGMGTETASLCETLHALSLNIKPSKIVFDSPCKTKRDLEQALHLGVGINLDNEHELSLVDDLLKNTCKDSKSLIGLRINPVVGGGTFAFTSTATKASKFGLPILPKTKVNRS